MQKREFRAQITFFPRHSELQNLIDPVTKFRDTCINARLIRRGATDSPADDSSKNPSFISRSLDDHWTAAVTLIKVEGCKLEY